MGIEKMKEFILNLGELGTSITNDDGETKVIRIKELNFYKKFIKDMLDTDK